MDDPWSAQSRDVAGRRLITSQQAMAMNGILGLFNTRFDNLDVVARYNLLYNVSLMVSEGIGSAMYLEGIFNTTGDTDLRFVQLESPP